LVRGRKEGGGRREERGRRREEREGRREAGGGRREDLADWITPSSHRMSAASAPKHLQASI
jgi:hypothetical protein